MRVVLRGGWAPALCLVMAGCASTRGAVPHPFPVPERARSALGKESVALSDTLAIALDTYALVGTALQLRGAPYRNGGTDPLGFDCSGFTQYVFGQYHIALPREVRDQFKVGMPIDFGSLEPGDLVFFSTTDPGASHVAIAIGPDEFVHAPSTTGVVRVERLSSSYWAPRYIGARRVTQP